MRVVYEMKHNDSLQNMMGSPASSVSLVNNGEDELARLREQILRMSTELGTLKRENIGLKERLDDEKLCFSGHQFNFSVSTETVADALYVSEPIELNGVTVILHGAVAVDSNGDQQLAFWCEMRSPSVFEGTLISKCVVNGNGSADKVGPFSQIIRLKEESHILSHRYLTETWNKIKTNVTKVSVKFTIKLVRLVNPVDISFDAGDNYVTVKLGKETLQVNAPYVSEWSSFLRAYFASQMKESQDGVYPIEASSSLAMMSAIVELQGCPIDDFREMLDVIYPTSKPIDVWNVEKMLELADRFIIPMLARLCEFFLNDSQKHNLTEIQMLTLADKYNLFLTRTNILEKATKDILRSKIIKTEGYANLSKDMKRAVEARYVELDVQEQE